METRTDRLADMAGTGSQRAPKKLLYIWPIGNNCRILSPRALSGPLRYQIMNAGGDGKCEREINCEANHDVRGE